MTAPGSGVRRVYAEQAPRYDRRWARYLEATLPPTLAALAPLPGERVLDVGCGTGALLEMLRARHPRVEAWGADLSPAMLARAAARLGGAQRLVLADAGRLPFAAGAFDAAATSSALHHWPDPEGALAEIARVVRPGGRLVVTDWADDHLPTRVLSRLLRLVDPSHHRSYTVDQAGRMLRRAGFAELRARRYRLGLKWGFMTLSAVRAGGGPPDSCHPVPAPR